MSTSLPIRVLLFVLLISWITGCTPSDPVIIKDAWARPPAGMAASNQGDHQGHAPQGTGGSRTAVYLSIQNNGALPERLLRASSPLADTVEIHRSWTDEKGVMRMLSLESVEILPEQELVFEPGGYHFMLIDVAPIQAGDSLQLSLFFEKSGTLSTSVEIGHLDR